MNSRNIAGKVRLRRTALALGLGFSLGLVSVGAMAQSNASGVIFGRADAAPGTTVHIENIDTGLSRDVTVDADGRYRATTLPVGRYRVTLQRDGQNVGTRDNVQVNVGSGTDVSFVASATAAQTLEGVQVVASALPAIDVSSVDTRTVLTADQLQKLPVARNVNAAVMLAPGSVQADSRYGNTVSLGGSSAAENQYYINGYAVTNPLTGVGFTSLPFNAIEQEQVFYGGYGAEYGRSTGGVINIITKRGGNTWKAGVQGLYTPADLRATPRAIYRKDGVLVADSSRNDLPWEAQYGAYVSGPIVKDKLFLYASGEWTRSEQSTHGATANSTTTEFEDKARRWLVKLDWNITDNHILELTGIGDQTESDQQIWTYNYETDTVGDSLGAQRVKNYGTATSNPGGEIYVGKYTGYLTDNLTVSALYGQSKAEHVNQPISASGVACPIVQSDATLPPGFIRGCQVTGGQVLAAGANDKTDGWRLDVEYRLGDHTLRAGVDNMTIESFAGSEREGGGTAWIYSATPPDRLIRGGTVEIPAGNDMYVTSNTYRAIAPVKVEQEAQFIEDVWQISDRWLAKIGLRNEQFSNFNGDGVVYAKQRHQLAPRLGISWDVNGDSSLKIYANAGRYHLAIPANVAVRGASGQYFALQAGTFDGMDPVTKAPLNFTPVEDPVYQNGADGTSPDPKEVAAKGLGAYYQDEYILGFDKTLGPDWTFGAKAVYRDLGQIIDDICDARPFHRWAVRNGVDDSTFGERCYLINPGQSNDFVADIDGDGVAEDVHLTQEDIGLPEAKRKYVALNLYLEHQFSDKWFGRIDYTLSRSFGNSEGLLKSDIGQLDPSVTQDWDFPELMIGANGPEANDRTHQIRAYGYYQLNQEWLFSGLLMVNSGRPKNCIGNWEGAPPTQSDYGESFFFCGPEGTDRLKPRGSMGRLPWSWRFDAGVEYRPSFANHNLALTAKVYNIFNEESVTRIYEWGESGAVGVEDPNYGRPTYSAPRYFQFGVRYDFSM